MKQPSSYLKKVRSGFWFKGGARRIMHLVKYSRRYQLMGFFKEACREKFTYYFPGDAVIIPVPLYYLGYWKRGFNQAEIIAKWISHASGLKRDQNHLMKIRKTSSQSTLSKEKRQSNLSGVFQWVGKKPPPRAVLLVDDIYTTGATLRACAKTLLKSGAEEVYAWTLFRTPGMATKLLPSRGLQCEQGA
jgi:competence protein ComFC